jgi:tetratricopeptide (TPR) repeat protein
LATEVWLREGAYRPAADEFERRCDAAAPWFALGDDPTRVPSIEIDAFEMLGTIEEQSVWSSIWSAARTMEFARLGELQDAYDQFDYTIELIADWPPSLSAVSEQVYEQIREALEHVAEITVGMKDPPVDDDTLMIPAFYLERKPPASRQHKAKHRSLGQEVEELIRAIKAGRVAVFCGAGISIASGIPPANELRRAILTKLPASELEITRLVENDLPFEAFMEVLSQLTDLGPLMEVFVGKEPSATHVFLAGLGSRGLIKTIATTNFDELIERAGANLRNLVIKLHGTISSPESIAVTMEAVAGRQRLPEREEAIDRIFAHGEHEAVLVVGYSCSDLFDISPAIEALGESLKRIWIVEHDPREKRAEDIVGKTWKNPFRQCRHGTRLFCDTDALFQRIARETSAGEYARPAIAGNTRQSFFARWWNRLRAREEVAIDQTNKRSSPVGHGWQTFVDRWWNHVDPRDKLPLGHAILGQLWYLCADFRAAKIHYRASLVRAGPWQDPTNRCYALIQIAGCHRALSEYKRALERGREAHRLAKALRDDHLEAQAARTIGNAHFNMGDVAEAIKWYQRDVDLLRKLGDQERALGSSLANLANAFGASRDFDKALECFEEGIELARDLGDKVGEASRLGGMGQVFGMMKRWQEAEATHLQALDISKAMANVPGVATQLAQLAKVEDERSRFDKAIELAIDALTLFSEIGDRQGEARALGNLGGYYLKTGKVSQAAKCFKQSQEIAAAISDRSVFEVAQRNLDLIARAGKQ